MHTITVLGLGPGEKDQMPVNVYEKLTKSDHVMVRTSDHPILKELADDGLVFETLDCIHSNNLIDADEANFEIVTKLIEKAKHHPVVYAVHGHPIIGEKTVKELIKRYEKVEILDGRSLLKDLIESVEIDVLEGLQLVDSADLNYDKIQTGQHVFIMQVFNVSIAKEVKLALMEKYPADHIVALIEAAGSRLETVSWLPLYETDRFMEEITVYSLYIPPLLLDEQVTSLSTLQHYIDKVTAPEGDVWINEQTPNSLIQYLKEETGELIEAIEKEDTDNWMEELGDVLVQILYQTNAAEKEGLFTFEDVLSHVNRKIRRRHPHVFDGVEANTPEEVDAIWQKIKQEEKRMKDET